MVSKARVGLRLGIILLSYLIVVDREKSMFGKFPIIFEFYLTSEHPRCTFFRILASVMELA